MAANQRRLPVIPIPFGELSINCASPHPSVVPTPFGKLRTSFEGLPSPSVISPPIVSPGRSARILPHSLVILTGPGSRTPPRHPDRREPATSPCHPERSEPTTSLRHLDRSEPATPYCHPERSEARAKSRDLGR